MTYRIQAITNLLRSRQSISCFKPPTRILMPLPSLTWQGGGWQLPKQSAASFLTKRKLRLCHMIELKQTLRSVFARRRREKS